MQDNSDEAGRLGLVSSGDQLAVRLPDSATGRIYDWHVYKQPQNAEFAQEMRTRLQLQCTSPPSVLLTRTLSEALNGWQEHPYGRQLLQPGSDTFKMRLAMEGVEYSVAMLDLALSVSKCGRAEHMGNEQQQQLGGMHMAQQEYCGPASTGAHALYPMSVGHANSYSWKDVADALQLPDGLHRELMEAYKPLMLLLEGDLIMPDYVDLLNRRCNRDSSGRDAAPMWSAATVSPVCSHRDATTLVDDGSAVVVLITCDACGAVVHMACDEEHLRRTLSMQQFGVVPAGKR